MANEQPRESHDPALAQAMDFLYGRINYERLPAPTKQFPFRLARMRGLLSELDHPDQGLAVVHIGGTKGKGSTSTMVAAMLSAAGYRTGLYTSPHLNQLGERFRVDGAVCSDADLIPLIAQVRDAAQRLERDGKGSATFFELTTAIALLHFRTQQCQAAVLEVGLGGRLDSTNVCHPQVTAITSVGLDHQHILGHTVAEIAAEKAGIFKPGVLAISGVADGPAAQVIQSQARQRGAPLWQLGREFSVDVDHQQPTWGTSFDYHSHIQDSTDRSHWHVPLEGAHQGRNAAIALAVMDALASCGSLNVPLADQRRGLSQVVCPARIERFTVPASADTCTDDTCTDDQVSVLLDAAHNEDSIAALCEVIRRRGQGKRLAVVFGTSHDKDAPAQLRQLLEVTDSLFLTRFHENPRWRDPASLAELAAAHSAAGGAAVRASEIRVIDLPAEALSAAIQAVGAGGMAVICGSFFLAAELRPLLRT